MKPHLLTALLVTACAGPLRAAAPPDLIRLYEEEILAHDLYVALAKVHPGIMPLSNIPHSEARHRESMASVLKQEGIRIPRPPAGRRFVTDELDGIFTKWLAEGTRSEKAACRVGTRLEDFDIAELRKVRARFPEHVAVLTALEAASGNHLRAFHRNLVARGGGYKAEALSDAELQEILNGQNPCGAGACGQPGNGNGAGNGPQCRGAKGCDTPQAQRGQGNGRQGRGPQGKGGRRWRGDR